VATRNFNVKNGLTAGNITLDATTNTTTTANLVVTGNANLTTAANIALGSNSNVKLTGGSSGQYLQTDGAGNLSWQSISGATSIANGTSNVRIPVANGNVVVSVNGVANIATFTSNAVFRGSYGLTGAISQANTAPSSPQNGDQWYNTFNGILFEYLDDGTSSQWVDISGLPLPNLAAVNASAVLNNVQSTGTYFPAFISSTANGNYALSSNTAFSANLANGALIATTFVGALSGAATSATTAGTVTTAAQPNITSVGTLTSLAVTGNANVGNLNATTAVIASTLTSNVATGTAPLTVTSTTRVANLNVAQANLADFISVAAGTGNNFLVFANAATGNITELTSTGLTANLSNNSITATTFVGALSGAATSATTAGTVTTAAQPNITSVGTLTSLAVTGNVTAGNANVTGQLISTVATGTAPIVVSSTTKVANLNADLLDGYDSASTATAATIVLRTGDGSIIGNLIYGAGNNLSNIQGANVTGAVASATTAGTVTTAAQPNITSVGTLTSATVTGNVAAGNLTTTGVLSVTGTGVSSIAGNLDMTSNTIINLATPTNSTDAATKQYVDDVAQGLHTHDSCNAATQTTLASISGGTVTYNNGASGVGANLTTTGTFTTIDGVTLSNGMRILVKNEANAAHNGIYDRTSTTVLTRSDDFNTPTEMAGGDFVFVTAGTLYDNTGWVMTDPVTTVGTTNVNWVQFSGAGTYTAGTGLTLTGSQFSVNASQTQVTSVGTLTGLNSSGTITAPAFTANTGVFTGNGSGLSAIAGANVTGTVSSATSATTAGTVTTAAQPNITSVSTSFSGLTFVANAQITMSGAGSQISGVNLISASSFSGNGSSITGINASSIASGTLAQARLANSTLTLGNTTLTLGGTTTTVAGLSSVTSTTFVGALTGAATSATTAGTVTTAAQPNITSVGTLTSATVSGNSNLPVINVSRVNSAITGRSWYSPTYTSWSEYMSPAGAANVGPSGLVTAPSGTLVNSWALRSFIENPAGYGWTWESGTSNQVTPTVVAEIRSSDGAARFGSVQTPTLTTGANSTAGTVTGNWTLTAGSRWQATYADLAEKYAADATYEPGTVLLFGGEQEVTLANAFDSTKVAGVVTTNPAYSMNAMLEAEYVAEIALQGRVPCKVQGPVEKGDLMVSASNGHATANNEARAGTIIGKALENFNGDFGVIEVAVGRF
jgi:hypothetical protein